jgi:hypothetical protein
VVLTEDIPDAELEAGDIGTVVHVHARGAGYEVEFMTLAGTTAAVVTLSPAQLRPIQPRATSPTSANWPRPVLERSRSTAASQCRRIQRPDPTSGSA